MFCTTVIATVGRHTLARAVNSVLDQKLPGAEFEVIVVNDSGRPLPAEPWQLDARVQVVMTQKHERSVARNTGAAMARGEYLHFLDDDDWMTPGAFATLATKAQECANCGMVYGATQLVDRSDAPIIRLAATLQGNCAVQAMAGEWIPLQSTLIKASVFFAVGGFDYVPLGEDVNLLRRVTVYADVASVPDIVACVEMGAAQSTTRYLEHYSGSRRARERALDEPNTYRRLRAAVRGPEWSGRLVRIYATSAVWNVRNRRYAVALGRGMAALRSLLGAGGALASGSFWSALATKYDSPTFLAGFAEAGRPVERTVLR